MSLGKSGSPMLPVRKDCGGCKKVKCRTCRTPLDYSVRTSTTFESAQQTFSINGDSNYLTIQEYFLAAASRNVSSRDQRSSLF